MNITISLKAFGFAIAVCLGVMFMAPVAHCQPVHSASGRLSEPANQAVVVPFELGTGGRIQVNLEVDGQTASSILDTGAYMTLLPASFKFVGKRSFSNAGEEDVSATDYQGRHHGIRTIIVPLVRLGVFEVKDFPLNVETVSKLERDATSANQGGIPLGLLANSLFKDRCLTIDYDRRELSVSLVGYDPSGAAQTDSVSAATMSNGTNKSIAAFPQRSVLKFDLDFRADTTIGCPVITTLVEGVRARLMIDTGWNGAAIGISSHLFNAVKRRRKQLGVLVNATKDAAILQGDPAQQDTLGDITTTINVPDSTGVAYQITTEGTQFAAPGTNIDGILGWSFLRHFRKITFDFGRQKVYFEPWTPGSPQDRTGIFPNPAMAKAQQRRTLAAENGFTNRMWDTFFGSYASNENAVHYQSTKWDGGFAGDLWDDGTFVRTTMVPAVTASQVSEGSLSISGYIVYYGVTYVIKGDNTLTRSFLSASATSGRPLQDVPRVKNFAAKNGQTYVVLIDGTVTPLLVDPPQSLPMK